MMVPMPTYRSAPSPTAGTVSAPAFGGETGTAEVWQEAALPDRDGNPEYTYYLVAVPGIATYPAQAITGTP